MTSLFENQRMAAAEWLRGFGQVGDSLQSCLDAARRRAETKETQERCRVATELLGLD